MFDDYVTEELNGEEVVLKSTTKLAFRIEWISDERTTRILQQGWAIVSPAHRFGDIIFRDVVVDDR